MKRLIALLATFLMLTVPFALVSEAAVDKGGYVLLYQNPTSGGDFRAHVDYDTILSMDSTEWKFPAYVEPTTSGSGTNVTLKLVYSITANNKTLSKTNTVAAVNDKIVWANFSFDPNLLSADNNAKIDMILENATGATLDNYTVTVQITSNAGGYMTSLFLAVFGIMLPIVIIIPLVKGMKKNMRF